MEQEENPTTDLSKFGGIEIETAIDLLKAYNEQGAEYLEDNVHICFNNNSGYVFLMDEDYNVAMLNGDKLEQWFYCPNCGFEGFKGDFIKHSKDKECREYIKQVNQ
jgi:hypothetical protein